MFAIQAIQYSINRYHNLEFIIKLVQVAVEQVVIERRENIAREAFKCNGKDAAQAVLTRTRHQ